MEEGGSGGEVEAAPASLLAVDMRSNKCNAVILAGWSVAPVWSLQCHTKHRQPCWSWPAAGGMTGVSLASVGSGRLHSPTSCCRPEPGACCC